LKPRIFISYSSKNRKEAEAIHQHLESSHFEVWRDQTRLETDWSREIAEALAQCDLLCLIWSAYAEQSKWVKHEWLTARALEKHIIVCWLPKAPDLPEPLHNLHAVKFNTIKEGLEELIERLDGQQNFKVKYEYHILPPNSFIPFNPNPEFTGRENDLLELYLKMIGNLNKIGINQVGTVGMGGIGKTQLVVEFAYRYSFAFHSVHWIQATNSNEWMVRFVNLAKNELQLQIADPESPDAHNQYIFALRNHFRAHPNCLVVMDNVIEPELLNNDTLPFGLTPLTLGCDLLFTTQSQFNIPGVTAQPIDILLPEAAYALLTSYRTLSTLDEKEHAEAILNAVGYLPLAIILIGAYLREYASDISFADYHEELKKNKLDTIDIGGLSSESLATRHIAAVAKTLKSQWDMLQNEDAKYLFKLAGQFGEAEIIPKARLTLLASKDSGITMIQQLRVKVFKSLYKITARLGFFEGTFKRKSNLLMPLSTALNHLHKLNLMERLEEHDSAIRLHPLIHVFARVLVKEHKQTSFKARAARNLKRSYFQYTRLENELLNRGVHEVINDLQVAINWWGNKNLQLKELTLLLGALRLSSSQLLKKNCQLTPQLLGRLQNQKLSGIKTLLKQALKEKKGLWLRPITTSLISPGILTNTLVGHRGEVNAIAIHPDGQSVVSSSSDCTIKIWELKTGKEHTLKGHETEVKWLSISTDGKRIISVSKELFNQKEQIGYTIKVWDFKTRKDLFTQKGKNIIGDRVIIDLNGKWVVSSYFKDLHVWNLVNKEESYTLEGHSGSITKIAIQTNGQRIVSASQCILKVWNLETKAELHTLSWHCTMITAVAIPPNGQKVVFAFIDNGDNKVNLWDLETEEVLQLHTLKEHSGIVTVLVLHPNGKWVVTGDNDGTIKVWDLESREELRTLKGHSQMINLIVILPDGQRVISTSWDKTIKVWNLDTGNELYTLKGHSRGINSVAIHPDGQQIISGSGDNTLKVWDLNPSIGFHTQPGHNDKVNVLVIHPDRQRVVSGSEDKTLKVWNLKTGEELHTLRGHSDRITVAVLHPDGQRVVSGSNDKTLKVWNLNKGIELYSLEGHNGGINALTIHPDRQRVISASWDYTLKVWNLKTGEALHTLKGHTQVVNGVAIHPDGQRMITASLDKTLKVWDLESGEELYTLSGHTDRIWAIAIQPAGHYVFSASLDHTVKIWDLKTGTEIDNLEGHNSWVYGAAIHPHGQQTVSTYYDNTIKGMSARTLNTQTLVGSSNEVTVEIIEPNRQRVVSAFYDNSLVLWDLKTGSELHTLQGHNDHIEALAIHPNGQQVVSASRDKTLILWDVNTGAKLASFWGDSAFFSCAIDSHSNMIVAGDEFGGIHFLKLEGIHVA